ncbi:hypothetical protein OUL59_002104 [Salmonella enterica subsp. enterica serovar Hato]|nr:hypothetical protein [Salmonella enterica]HAK2208141.1 hypothetical protein [Salmonella enterica]
MSGTDAELGFSVDTSQITAASSSLDDLAKSAKGATDAASKLADQMSKPINMHAGGYYSGLISKTKEQLERAEAEIAESAKKTGGNWFTNFISGIKENHGALRELGVMSHEAMSGRWANLRGSASIFMGAAGLGGLAGTGIIMGVTGLIEGIEELTESMQEAAQAQRDLQQSSILSGNANALFSGKVDDIVNGLQTIKYASREAKEEFISNALNAGLTPDFLKKNGSLLLQYQQEFGDKQTEAMEKILAETQTNATKGYAALYKMGDGLLDKVNKDIESGNYKTAGSDIMAGLLQGMQNEVTESQGKQGELKQSTWWDDALSYMGMGAMGYSSAGVQVQQNILNGMRQRKDFIIKKTDEYHKDVANSINSSKSKDLSDTKEYHDFNAFYHASFSHHGLTAAQRAANKAAADAERYAQQLSDYSTRVNEQFKSMDLSINKRWANKNQPFSDLSSDAYDFEQTQEQINEQFDNMIDNLKIMAEHQHKSISSPEFVKQIADINKMRGDALEDNLKGYNNYEDNLHSVLAGAKKGMKSYQETSDKVALQVAQVWDKSLDYMTDSLTDFFTTGEAGWKNYLKDILTMIEKVMVRDVIVAPFSNWMGDLLGVGSSGNASAAESAMDYNSLPVPSVPNLSATKTSGVGSSSASGIQVYVYNQGGNTNGNVQSSTKQGQDLGKALQRAAQNWIKQQNVQSNRQGGTNKAMNSWSVK